MSEWISVAKSLPDIARPVWLYVPDRPPFVGGRNLDSGDWFWCDALKSEYMDRNGNWCCSMLVIEEDLKPSHWQPLPEPPK